MSEGKLKLLVNGEPCDVAAGCTIAGLVQTLGLDRQRIAVAVNRDVIPRSLFAAHALGSGDKVEILEAVGGG